MKRLWIAAAILAALFCATLLNSWYLRGFTRELTGLLEQAERYRELKPIHTQLNAIHRKGQREKFKAAHEGELRQFYMARRKLEPHFTPEGKLPLTKWRTERG